MWQIGRHLVKSVSGLCQALQSSALRSKHYLGSFPMQGLHYSESARAAWNKQVRKMPDNGFDITKNAWTFNDPIKLDWSSMGSGGLGLLPSLPCDGAQSAPPYFQQGGNETRMFHSMPWVDEIQVNKSTMLSAYELPGGIGVSRTPPAAPPIPWSLLERPKQTDKKKKANKASQQMQNSMCCSLQNSDTEHIRHLVESIQEVEDKDGDDVSTAPSSLQERSENYSSGDSLKVYPAEADEIDSEVLSGEFSTLMLKNIPCRSSQQEVLDAIDAVGFGDRYNFFYLPIRRGHTQNFGYAFIGFGDKKTTIEFAMAMTGYRFPGRRSPKSCAVAPARIQGFWSNMEHFQKTQCMRRKNRPLLSNLM